MRFLLLAVVFVCAALAQDSRKPKLTEAERFQRMCTHLSTKNPDIEEAECIQYITASQRECEGVATGEGIDRERETRRCLREKMADQFNLGASNRSARPGAGRERDYDGKERLEELRAQRKDRDLKDARREKLERRMKEARDPKEKQRMARKLNRDLPGDLNTDSIREERRAEKLRRLEERRLNAERGKRPDPLK